MSRQGSRTIGWTPKGDYSHLAYTPPYRPGNSKYCVKGLGYRSFFEDCDRKISGGRAAVLAAIEQSELQEFFSQEFLPGSWFDVFPLPLGREVLARLAGVPTTTLVRESMQFTVKRDASGVYRSLLSRGGARAVMEALDIVARQYLNFCPLVRPCMVNPHARQVFRDDFPAVLFPWCKAFTEGYTLTALELAGVQGAHIDIRATPTEPAADGLECVHLSVLTSWEA